MTLRELVEKYKGEITFAVSKVVPGGIEDVIEFPNTDYEAIKDNIMDGTVVECYVMSSAARTTLLAVTVEIAEEP